jgi:spermidine synthase
VTAYAQKMMAFLLFNRSPRHILLIGLGGGSLVKFCHRHLPDTRLTVVEVDAEVIGLREWFHVPPDDDRLRVVLGDGADYVSRVDWTADVLLIDAFDSAGVAPSLATAEFYEQAFRRLGPNGVFVMNLSGERARYVAHVEQIRDACPGRILLVPVACDGNVLIFAFGDSAGRQPFESMEARAEDLQAELALEFPRFLRRLREGEVM